MRTISLKQMMLLVAIACQWFALFGRFWQAGSGQASGKAPSDALLVFIAISTLLVGNVVGGFCDSRSPGIGSRIFGAFLGGLLMPLTALGFVLAYFTPGPWLALGVAAVAVLGTFYLTRHDEQQ